MTGEKLFLEDNFKVMKYTFLPLLGHANFVFHFSSFDENGNTIESHSHTAEDFETSSQVLFYF